MIRALLASYFATLRDNPAVPSVIRHKDRQPELESLEAQYQAEAALLLLAWSGGQVCGCVALQGLPSREYSAEVKRLYVTPAARGKGVGRILLQAAVAYACDRGCRELLLDTLPAVMPDAVRLYRSLGFEPTERYNSNVGPEFAFYRRSLE